MLGLGYEKDLGMKLPVVKKTWALDELENILAQAIIASAAYCIRCNNGVIFTALSGGLDSSFCLAVIRQNFGEKLPIHTFTVGSSERHPDICHAKMVAETFKTLHHSIVISPKEIPVAILFKKNNIALFPREEAGIDGLGPYFLLQAVSEYARRNDQDARIGLIVHDGIDELLGGYWCHRTGGSTKETEDIFNSFWQRFVPEHYIPFYKKASAFGVEGIYPYLQPSVVEYISRIPVLERTSHKVSKIPLRAIAEMAYFPDEISEKIISRKKIGFCDALTSSAEIAKRK